jgi:tetratricopeptide (TPR) repeat protein
MNRENLLMKLTELIELFNSGAFSTVGIETSEKIKRVLESYLESNPRDTEIWIKLALAFFFEEDIIGSIESMEKVLAYDPANEMAFVLWIWFYFYGYCDFSEDMVKKIESFSSKDSKLMAMLEFIKSRYYFGRDEEKRKKSLKKSIEYCDEFVWNNQKLAQLYIDQKQYDKAYPLIIRALNNIKNVHVATESTYYNFLDLDVHINEYLTGIWLNTIQYTHIVAMLENFYIPKDFSRDTIN